MALSIAYSYYRPVCGSLSVDVNLLYVSLFDGFHLCFILLHHFIGLQQITCKTIRLCIR